MKILKFAFLFTIAMTLLFGPSLQAYASDARPVTLNEEEQTMLDLVNNERLLHGLKPLATDSRLIVFARSYADEMAGHDFFSHVSPVSGDLLSRVTSAGFKHWTIAGENLADAPTATDAFEALMDSPSHRANMLSPRYSSMGIGVAEGGDCGTLFVQEFMAFENSTEKPKIAVKK